MDLPPPPPGPIPFRNPDLLSAALRPQDTARLMASAGDVTLVMDRDGVIRDLAVGSTDMDSGAFAHWIDQPWVETVTPESRGKITEMLRDAAEGEPRWRQVNHEAGDNGQLPVRYFTLRTGGDGSVIAIGRDMRMAAALQQRLLSAQQSMERDYLRLRQTEMRYRLLFDLSAEPVMIVDGATRRLTEANPAARRLLTGEDANLAGQSFAAFIHPADRDAAIAMLGAASATQQARPIPLRLARESAAVPFRAALFRQDRTAHFLVRAEPPALTGEGADSGQHLPALLDRMPDGFALAGADLRIIEANASFLDLTHLPRVEDLKGLSLGDFIGRPGIDLGVLVAELETHGVVRNFETIFRSRYGDEELVELSAVSVPGPPLRHGFVIRPTARRLTGTLDQDRGAPRSVDQLTELVGRVPLKDIVRESTDLIERLCIEAALEYTGDNRANAAEMLGLSRQSLYSKLRRHGIFTPANGEGEEAD